MVCRGPRGQRVPPVMNSFLPPGSPGGTPAPCFFPPWLNSERPTGQKNSASGVFCSLFSEMFGLTVIRSVFHPEKARESLPGTVPLITNFFLQGSRAKLPSGSFGLKLDESGLAFGRALGGPAAKIPSLRGKFGVFPFVCALIPF